MIHGYARVSTAGQQLASQLDALAFCDQIHQEAASTRGDLPVLAQLINKQLAKGDTLAVTRLDRLGRSVPGIVQLVADLQARGVNLKVLAGDIDTSTAQGRFQLNVFAAFAELERDLMQERTREGLQAARKRGQTLGRPVSVTPEKIAAARVLLASGMSHTDITKTLGISRSALYRALPAHAPTPPPAAPAAPAADPPA